MAISKEVEQRWDASDKKIAEVASMLQTMQQTNDARMEKVLEQLSGLQQAFAQMAAKGATPETNQEGDGDSNQPQQNESKKEDSTAPITLAEYSGLRLEASPTQETDTSKMSPIFTFRELATATNCFRDESLIGQGGFGAVYRGKLENTGQVVAVKRLDTTGVQGNKEFLVEVLMLPLLRHPNLVNLIGYCAEGDRRLLVYEYMPLGSLESHLHDLSPGEEPLDWNTRIKIAVGAAKGLNYLHHEAKPPVIYRDLKSSNILLDEDFNPKLSDFGLAKFGPSGDRSHVSTRIMGTYGYCAPEYATTGKLTMRSDIYSFGVVLLELITGRRALDETRGREKYLVEWARPIMRDRGHFPRLADPQLQGQYPGSSLKMAIELAFMCLREEPGNRPDSSDIVLALDYLSSRSCPPKESNAGNTQALQEDDSPKETSRMLTKDSQREQAVAEAKQWGETWREKRRQSGQSSSDGL